MMKTGKNNRFLASILAASMLLDMSPFAFAADTAEQKEMTTQGQVQFATQNETNANPAVSQTDGQSSEDTNPEAPKTEGQSPKDTNSEEGQPSEDVKLQVRTPLQEAAHPHRRLRQNRRTRQNRKLQQNRKRRKMLQRSARRSIRLLLTQRRQL